MQAHYGCNDELEPGVGQPVGQIGMGMSPARLTVAWLTPALANEHNAPSRAIRIKFFFINGSSKVSDESFFAQARMSNKIMGFLEFPKTEQTVPKRENHS
jgi:hypothetical protein